MAVDFFSRDIDFKLPQPRKTASWIRKVIDAEGYTISQISYIFCSDDYLLDLNQQFLHHDTLTDVITFDHRETKDSRSMEADIFISIHRVSENADARKIAFEDELHRVMIHGVLHLMGYSDKTTRLRAEMRRKEDTCLSLR